MTKEVVITVRDVPRLLLATDSYPHLGNHDWYEVDLLATRCYRRHKPLSCLSVMGDASATN